MVEPIESTPIDSPLIFRKFPKYHHKYEINSYIFHRLLHRI